MKTLDEELEDALIHIDTLNEQIFNLKEALKEMIPIAEIGLQYESQKFYDKYNQLVENAIKLLNDGKEINL